MRTATTLGAAALALAFMSGSTDVECRAIKRPEECMQPRGLMFVEICFNNAEDYYAAWMRRNIAHCRSMKDVRRGVRLIAVPALLQRLS